MTHKDSIKVQQLWLGLQIGIKEENLIHLVGGNKAALEEVRGLENVVIEKDALFTPYRHDHIDGVIHTLLEEQKFWQEFKTVIPLLQQSNIKLDRFFFGRKINDNNKVIEYSYASQARGAVFNPDLWEGREAEMMSVYYMLSKQQRTAIPITNVRREIASRAGQSYRLDIIEMALNQRSSSLEEVIDKGLIDLYKEVLDLVNLDPDTQDLMIPQDDDGVSNFHMVAHFNSFRRWVIFFRNHGLEFSIEDLARPYGDSNSFIQEAADTNLGAIFHKDIWAGRLDEMLELWSHVPQDKSKAKDVDINVVYEEAEDQTFASLDFTLDANTTKEDLFMPITLDGCNHGVCFMGTKAAWDQIDMIMDMMEQKGTPITLEDLYQTTGFTDETLMSKAVRFGHHGHVLSLIDPQNDIYLSFEHASQKSSTGHNFLDAIERDFKIHDLFDASLWAGNGKLMLQFWDAFGPSHAKDAVHNFGDKVASTNVETLRRAHQKLKQRRERKLKP